MSTRFDGEGNIGSAPEYHEFPNGNDEPRRLLRMSVYFDNPIPKDDAFEDRGGFWAPVEIWHRDAEQWSTLFQKGMRVAVIGARMVRDQWQDSGDNERVTFKVEARCVAILPYRIVAVTMGPKSSASSGEQDSNVS